jgi:hypothetical protein
MFGYLCSIVEYVYANLASLLFATSATLQALMGVGALGYAIFTFFKKTDGKIRFEDNSTRAAGYVLGAAALLITGAITARFI